MNERVWNTDDMIHEKTEEKSVPVQLCLPQIPH
jgi:hypothetical protein